MEWTMNRQQIISRLKQTFKTPGIPDLHLEQVNRSKGQPRKSADLVVHFKYGDKEFRLLCEVKGDARSITVENAISRLQELIKKDAGGENEKPCLVVPFLPETMRNRLRKRQISFIDLSGNVYISEPGRLHIERDGKPNAFVETQLSNNVFSDKRSLVLRYLFARPGEFAGVREIAEACQINPGGVTVAVKLLEEAGYIARDHRGRSKLVRWRELLEDWAAYCRVKKQNESRFYWNARSLGEMISTLASIAGLPGRSFALTRHAGAHLVAPYVNYEGLHAYVGDDEVRDELVEALKLRPVDKGANVFFLQPYYKGSVFYGARVVEGVKVVSDIQLYLDLKNFPVRGEEQAENLLRTVIAPFEESV